MTFCLESFKKNIPKGYDRIYGKINVSITIYDI